MRYLLILFGLLLLNCQPALDGQALLEKTIAYHDPENRWPDFRDSLFVVMETPDSPDRLSDIYIDNSNSAFYVRAAQDTVVIEYGISTKDCIVKLNGSDSYSEAEAKEHGLSCERAELYKNYYTYLYGLPMKLRDPGTRISPTVERRVFKEKEYLVLRADYEAKVGSDIWFFYFDPQTYAMEVYQFYRSEENGDIKKDSGEYILLSGEAEVGGVKMPRTRAWYFNKDDKYLGTDILK